MILVPPAENHDDSIEKPSGRHMSWRCPGRDALSPFIGCMIMDCCPAQGVPGVYPKRLSTSAIWPFWGSDRHQREVPRRLSVREQCGAKRGRGVTEFNQIGFAKRSALLEEEDTSDPPFNLGVGERTEPEAPQFSNFGSN